MGTPTTPRAPQAHAAVWVCHVPVHSKIIPQTGVTYIFLLEPDFTLVEVLLTEDRDHDLFEFLEVLVEPFDHIPVR